MDLAQSGSFSDKNVGTGKTVTYTDSLSGTDSGNYVLVSSTGTTTASITPAPLTITASNAGKTYDGSAYSGGNGVSYSGLVGGETAAVLSGSLTYGGTSQGAINAGSYSIIPSGLTSGNYAITYADGTLTIDPAGGGTSLVAAQITPLLAQLTPQTGVISATPALQQVVQLSRMPVTLQAIPPGDLAIDGSPAGSGTLLVVRNGGINRN